MARAAMNLAKRLAPQVKQLTWIGDEVQAVEPVPSISQNYAMSRLFDVPRYNGVTTGVGLGVNGDVAVNIPLVRFTHIEQGANEYNRLGVDGFIPAVEGDFVFYWFYRGANQTLENANSTVLAPYQKRWIRMMIVGEWDATEEVSAKNKPPSLGDLLLCSVTHPLGSDMTTGFRSQQDAMFSKYKPAKIFSAGDINAEDQQYMRQRRFHVYYDRLISLDWHTFEDGSVAGDVADALTADTLAQTRCKRMAVNFKVPVNHHCKWTTGGDPGVTGCKGNLYLYMWQDNPIQGTNSPLWWNSSLTPATPQQIYCGVSARVRSWLVDK